MHFATLPLFAFSRFSSFRRHYFIDIAASDAGCRQRCRHDFRFRAMLFAIAAGGFATLSAIAAFATFRFLR